MKTSPIVTFIAAGLLIGPFGLGLVAENGTTRLLAQLGVVFLLFDIGLGFSLKTVRESKGDLLGLAPMQMILCAAGFGLVGWLTGMDWLLALLIGAAAGISATAVVTQTLAERGIATCPLGRSATAVLVFQDIAGIFLLVIAVALSEGGGGALGATLAMAAVKAAVAVGVAILLGRFVIGPLFRLLSQTRNDDIFTAAALFLVLATAAATGALGLSLTLGAFLAGMIIADTPFKTVIRTEAKPFGALLLGFFLHHGGHGARLAHDGGRGPLDPRRSCGAVHPENRAQLAGRAPQWMEPGRRGAAGFCAGARVRVWSRHSCPAGYLRSAGP